MHIGTTDFTLQWTSYSKLTLLLYCTVCCFDHFDHCTCVVTENKLKTRFDVDCKVAQILGLMQHTYILKMKQNPMVGPTGHDCNPFVGATTKA